MQYANPYANTPRKERHRTTIEVPKRLIARLNAVHPQSGVLQTTINILLKKLDDELTRIGLNTYDTAAFEYSVAGAVLALPSSSERSTIGQSAQTPVGDSTNQTTGRNDDGRVAGMASTSARPSELSNDASTHGISQPNKGKIKQTKRAKA